MDMYIYAFQMGDELQYLGLKLLEKMSMNHNPMNRDSVS